MVVVMLLHVVTAVIDVTDGGLSIFCWRFCVLAKAQHVEQLPRVLRIATISSVKVMTTEAAKWNLHAP